MKTVIVQGAQSRTEEVGDIRCVFEQCGYNEVLIIRLREIALEYLPPAVIAKVPPPYFSDKVRAAYAAKGINLEWNLTILGDKGDTGDNGFFHAARRYSDAEKADCKKTYYKNNGIGPTKKKLTEAEAHELGCIVDKAGLTKSQLNAAALLHATLKAREEESLSVNLQRNILDALGGLDSDTFKQGSDFSKTQSEKGKLRGAQQSREKAEKDEVELIRGRGNVSSIIKELALMTDQFDYLSPKDELWPMLIGKLDELGLNPKEVYDDTGNPLRIDYRDGNGKTGQITFASFKSMVSTARKS